MLTKAPTTVANLNQPEMPNLANHVSEVDSEEDLDDEFDFD